MTEPEPYDPYAPPPEGQAEGQAEVRAEVRAGGQPDGTPTVARPGGAGGGRLPRLDAFGRPVRPRPEPGGTRAVILGAFSLPLAILAAPIGLVCAFFAIRTAVRAQRRAGSDGAVAPFATTGIVLGAIGAAASVLVLIVVAVFFGEMNDFRECMRGAGTETAKERCQTEFFDRLERRTGIRP